LGLIGANVISDERTEKAESQFKMVNQNRRLMIGGMALVAIGSILVVIGLLGFTHPIACAINGCPSIFSSNYAISWTEILLGLVFIISGTALLVPSGRKIVRADERESKEHNSKESWKAR